MRHDQMKGTTVVVAGATGAIGRACCASLLSHGATVVGLGRSHAKLESLMRQQKDAADRFHLLPLRTWEPASWQLVVDYSSRFTSGIDVFIHAAGQLVPGAFLELRSGQIDAIIETNFRGVVTAASVILPHMVGRGRGHFLVVGSLGGIIPMPYQSVYSATKFALRGFCLSLHEELRHQGVTVSLLSPGPVRTPMLDLEGTDPRAALTFADAPVEPHTVASDMIRLLESRTREISRPRWQRFGGAFLSGLPTLFGALYPVLAAIGRHRLITYRPASRESEPDGYGHSQSIQAA